MCELPWGSIALEKVDMKEGAAETHKRVPVAPSCRVYAVGEQKLQVGAAAMADA